MNKKEIDFRDPVVERVVNKFVSRSDVGFKKYGVTLDKDPSEMFAWLNHLQEELMDAVLYLQKAKEVYTEDFMEKSIKTEEKLYPNSISDIADPGPPDQLGYLINKVAWETSNT
jgi:hypothetical protein|tara:strand:- start:3021 stop:3362 length:342 start_codon:yes stop_codon:yes gene_type:complete